MNQETLLYRQIPGCYIQNGHVSSLAFRPMPKDKDKLSVYDGDKIEPEAALRHFIEELHGQTEGVLAVSGEECQGKGLPFVEDYSTHYYHALIDFSGKSGNACKRLSEYLRNFAENRGWLFRKKS